MTGTREKCRAELTEAPTWHRSRPLVAFALFIIGFAAATGHVDNMSATREFDSIAQFGLWVGVLSALVGFAAASCVYFMTWLFGIVRLCATSSPRAVLSWVGIVLIVSGVVFTFLFLGGTAAGESLDKALWAQTRPATVDPTVARRVATALHHLWGVSHAVGDRHWNATPRAAGARSQSSDSRGAGAALRPDFRRDAGAVLRCGGQRDRPQGRADDRGFRASAGPGGPSAVRSGS